MGLERDLQELPPKTCSIERLITNKDDIKKVIQGKKTATRRNGRYADVGEVMTLEDNAYIVERVYAQKIGELTDLDAKREGYETLEAYKASIIGMHPGMTLKPKMQVWVHEFKSIGNQV